MLCADYCTCTLSSLSLCASALFFVVDVACVLKCSWFSFGFSLPHAALTRCFERKITQRAKDGQSRGCLISFGTGRDGPGFPPQKFDLFPPHPGGVEPSDGLIRLSWGTDQLSFLRIRTKEGRGGLIRFAAADSLICRLAATTDSSVLASSVIS